jgi:hypothetical protein
MMTRLPEREALIQFFVERPALPLSEAAELLGWQPSELLAEIRGEEAVLSGNRIAWNEVAYWLLRRSPRAWLLESLGAHAALIPAELHLTEVKWRLPVYVVRAIERQAAVERRGRTDRHVTAEDYVADALDLAIDDDTVATFRDDAAFRDAYDYPGGADDDVADLE